MKIIDWEKKGNVIRFYMGSNDCFDYKGDDWDEKPYNENADHVNEKFVKKYIDIAFPFDWLVVEPADDWRCHTSKACDYSMNDFKDRKLPCIIAVPKELYYDNDLDFFDFVGSDISGIWRFYLGDSEQVINPVGRSWVEV